MQNSSFRLLAFTLILLLLSDPVSSQQPSAEQQLARAQGLLRQVSAQKQELEVANARMQTEIASMEKKLNKLEAGLKETKLDLQSQERATNRTSERLEMTRERLTRTTERLRETIEQLRETDQNLRQTQFEKSELEVNLAETQANLADSELKNMQLYELNVEILEEYRSKGVFSALFQREPLTGLKDVEIQNTVQEYRAKSEDALREANRQTLNQQAADELGD